MSIGIEETDNGTKAKAKKQIESSKLVLDESLIARIEEWWVQVVMTAYLNCPKKTGTLAATIRREPMGYAGTTGEVVTVPLVMGEEGIPILEEVLVAGGILTNPETGMICDYATYVHDGLGTNTKYGPRPFLTDALDQHMEELMQILLDASNDMEKEFARDC